VPRHGSDDADNWSDDLFAQELRCFLAESEPEHLRAFEAFERQQINERAELSPLTPPPGPGAILQTFVHLAEWDLMSSAPPGEYGCALLAIRRFVQERAAQAIKARQQPPEDTEWPLDLPPISDTPQATDAATAHPDEPQKAEKPRVRVKAVTGVLKKQLPDDAIHALIKEAIDTAARETPSRVINRDDARRAVRQNRREARQGDIDRCFQDARYDGLVRRRPKGED
jgi:hypothetical protein